MKPAGKLQDAEHVERAMRAAMGSDGRLGDAMRNLPIFLLCVVLATVAACSGKSSRLAKPLAPAGEVSKPGAFLAYEHTVRIQTAAENLPARMQATRSACVEARFGACTLLSFNQDDARHPSGSIVVRIVPAGVEPLVALAGDGGTIGSRETKAEDRAEVVADIEQKKELLTRQRARLAEFELLKDLPVGDMLALTRESTQIELQLDELTKARANEQHRIETNLLTIGFHVEADESRWGQIGAASAKVADQFADGTADTIEIVAYALPMLFVALLFAVFLRWVWRRLPGRRAAR